MSDCPFCRYQNNGKKLYEGKYFYLIVPSKPAMYGHVLVVSKNQDGEHIEDIADPKLSQKQLNSMIGAVRLLARWMKKELSYEGKNVKKVYVLTQCETQHFHFHLKPRYKKEEKGDVFLCLKELEEARWITNNSYDSNAKNLDGIKRLETIEFGLCKHRNLLDSGKWSRPNPERGKFIEKIEKELKAFVEKHQRELAAL